ncbi:SCO1664 family protein [Arthrobacter sp. 7Tela_A1]
MRTIRRSAAVVYKPVARDKPLWDFPDGCLAHREVATNLVSEALRWNIVPRTCLRNGSLGEGMVQLWQETGPEQNAVDLVAADDVPKSGWREVLQGQGESGRIVALIHEDSAVLRRMAVFEVLLNNADRMGNHVLAMSARHRCGVDHGHTFQRASALRNLRASSVFSQDCRVSWALSWRSCLLLTKFASLVPRCARLRSAGRFPAPSSGTPSVPWPLF